MILRIFEIITQLVASTGYLGVFVTMTLESTLIPIPSEAVMPFAGFLAYEGKMDITILVLISSAANVLGSIIAYIIGKYLGRGFVEKFGKYVLLDMGHVELVEKWFQKYGAVTVLFSRMVPVVRTVNAVPAGIGEMNFFKFCLYTFLGSLPWNLALVLTGYFLKENWNILERYTVYIDIVAAAAIIVILVYIARKIRWGAKAN